LSAAADAARIVSGPADGQRTDLGHRIGCKIVTGEISLASAISSNDWVSSHEQYGRNR
jgi:hydroxymethylglutaryl-CoA reductase (NADPH)